MCVREDAPPGTADAAPGRRVAAVAHARVGEVARVAHLHVVHAERVPRLAVQVERPRELQLHLQPSFTSCLSTEPTAVAQPSLLFFTYVRSLGNICSSFIISRGYRQATAIAGTVATSLGLL